LYNFNDEVSLSSKSSNRAERPPNEGSEIKIEFNLIEDPRESEFSYKKVVLI
jgi:hypothetical protein